MQTILLLLSIMNIYTIKWTNTIIEIPLGENVSNYIELPKAELYEKNKLLTNELHYYERGINRTSLTVLNSNYVKEFKIDYGVTYYELGISFEHTITFKIVDMIPPEILITPRFKYPLNTKLPTTKELLEGLIYQDNYYDNNELIVKINKLNEININRTGVYEIEYEIMDPSFNVTKKMGTYEVIDVLYPVIEYPEHITHEYGIPFDYLKYFIFKATNLTTNVNLDNVDVNTLGTYQITVSATNQSGLKTEVTTIITIIDNTPPTIVLKNNLEDINVFDDTYNLLDYILSVSDNCSDLTLKDVTYVTDLDINKVGKYFVEYTLIDDSNNKASKTININVKDLEKPLISHSKPLAFEVNESKPYYLNYLDITDNLTHYNDLVITINDKGIDYNKIGDYYLDITVKDESSNTARSTLLVSIKDLIAPEVIQREDFVIHNFKKIDSDYIKAKFEIFDNYDDLSDIIITIDDTLVNYNVIGTYPLIITFSDKSGNTKVYPTSLSIIDTEIPKISLTNSYFYYFIGDNKTNLIDFVSAVSDNYDTLLLSDVIIEEDIDYNNVGRYKVVYQITDSSKNQFKVSLDFYVDVRRELLINGTNLNLVLGDNWTPLNGITLSDSATRYELISTNTSFNLPGNYELLYIAYDMRGNFDVYKQTITVNEVEKELDQVKIIYAITLSIIYLTSLTIYYYKERNNKTKYFDNEM